MNIASSSAWWMIYQGTGCLQLYGATQSMYREHQDWELLNNTLTLISKRRQQVGFRSYHWMMVIEQDLYQLLLECTIGAFISLLLLL